MFTSFKIAARSAVVHRQRQKRKFKKGSIIRRTKHSLIFGKEENASAECRVDMSHIVTFATIETNQAVSRSLQGWRADALRSTHHLEFRDGDCRPNGTMNRIARGLVHLDFEVSMPALSSLLSVMVKPSCFVKDFHNAA